MSRVLTFHKILPGCEAGNIEAWKAFLADYTPMALHCLGVYSPWTSEERWDCWRAALRSLSANECGKLKEFSHQSEREFLVELRAFLQDSAAPRLEHAHDAAEPPAPTLQTLDELLVGLPLVHQEVVFLTLAGYSQATLEKILRITPAVAGDGLTRLRAGYARVVERNEDRCLWPSVWIGICQAARAGQTKDCTPLRQLIRILDGQASWYEKTPADEHRAKCRHCLERWTSLLEVSMRPWTRLRTTSDNIEGLLVDIPVKTGQGNRSLVNRLFGR